MKKEKRSIFYRFAVATVPKIYRAIFSCKVQGLENIPETGPVIITSSHSTMLDPIFIGDICGKRRVRFMAKDGLFEKKVIGSILRSLGAFPVVRGSGGEDALALAKEILNDGGVLCVFIEGTRSKDGELQKPKTGASLLSMETNSPVIPVAITCEDGGIPRRGKKTLLTIGKLIPVVETGMTEQSSMHYRRGAKYIMSKISELRQKSLEKFKKENSSK